MWFTVNAAIDGIDAGSEDPIERMKFFVYQRRMYLDVLKTKALLTATLAPERAAEVAKAYLELAIPTSEEEIKKAEFKKELMLQEVANMKPIPISSIRLGNMGKI